MTQLAAAVPTVNAQRLGARAIGLWAVAGLLVLVAHVAVGYGVQSFSLANESDGGPPPAVTIDLAPMMLSPATVEDAPPDVVTPDQPDQTEETVTGTEPAVQPETETPREVTEEEEIQPDDTAPAETAAAEQPDQPPPLDEVVPDIVPAIAPDVVIPLPQAKPVEEKPVEKPKKVAEKPKPKPKKEKKEKAAPPKTVQAASADAKPAAKASAPKAAQASGSSVSPARWNSQLIAWINRHKRYPAAARSRRAQGTVNVTFVVNASGRVTSARLTRSSGDADLDRAALSILQGATVPAPPPEKAGTAVVAPLVFTLR